MKNMETVITAAAGQQISRRALLNAAAIRHGVRLACGAIRPSTICAGLACYVAYRVIHGLWLSPARGIPGPLYARISSVPSRVLSLFRSTNDDMVAQAERYGPVFLMEPQKVAVCHPDDCRAVLGSYAFVKDTMYANVDFMEPNIFLTRDAGLNRQRRRQIGPALSVPGLQRMAPAIMAAGPRQLLAKWDAYIEQQGGQRARVCYYDDLTLMSFDVIASLGFGQHHRSLTTGDSTIAHWVEKTFALMILQMALPAVKYWPLRPLANRVLGAHVAAFFEFARGAVQQRRLAMAKGLEHSDMLQQFINAQDPHGCVRMTSRQVITETIMMLLSGADTSSTAMAWTLHLLTLHPEHLAACTRQVRAAFARDALVSYADAREHAPFLEACILESMRVCPVSTNLPRIVPDGGVTLRGHFIPAGFRVAVSTAAANHDPHTWPDPHRFDPHRFAADNPAADANRRNLMTMSAGVRICPGRHLVMFEMVVTLANILNRYDLHIPSDALFAPEIRDARGHPRIMPRTNLVAMVPKHPSRDCNLVISRRP